VIEDTSGSSITIRGRAGLLVRLGDCECEVDSEMLAVPMGIALYPGSIRETEHCRASEILSFVVAGLVWAGFDVDVIRSD
jgi:hypothetical protein